MFFCLLIDCLILYHILNFKWYCLPFIILIWTDYSRVHWFCHNFQTSSKDLTISIKIIYFIFADIKMHILNVPYLIIHSSIKIICGAFIAWLFLILLYLFLVCTDLQEWCYLKESIRMGLFGQYSFSAFAGHDHSEFCSSLKNILFLELMLIFSVQVHQLWKSKGTGIVWKSLGISSVLLGWS